jgi:hypothetical protein
MEILIPTSVSRGAAQTAVKAYQLKGKRVGIVSNGWVSMEAIGGQMSRVLKEKYGVAEITHYGVHINKPITEETLRQVASECDAAIVGIAN